MKPHLAHDAALVLLMLGTFIVGSLWGTQAGWLEATGQTSLVVTVLPAPTEVATEGLAMVVVVTPTTSITPSPRPSPTPYMTPTGIPDCRPDSAIVHLTCREPFPSPTVRVQTPIAIWSTEVAVPGQLFVWAPTREPTAYAGVSE